ncbi:ABC transporter ATP-binding protein [soil metagenome]
MTADPLSSDSAPAVLTHGLGKIFNPGRPGAVEAVADIDLTVPQGGFTSLIGPSGCGKSTLLRLIGALTEPTSGTVEVLGHDADTARRQSDYGMAFQKAGLFDWRTVSRNIELPLELAGWSTSKRRARSAELLELVQLTSFADHRPAQLSGGMQQRVAIARALAASPQLLLMDEPFGALDEMTREHMQTELLDIWERTHTTVLFVTHSIPEAVLLSRQVVVMSPRPGRIDQVIDIDLGQRTDDTREDPAFFAAVTQVREALRAVEREAGPALAMPVADPTS